MVKDDGFQLGPAALDVGRLHSPAWPSTPSLLAEELVTRNTFLEYPEHCRNQCRERAVSEDTGRKLLEQGNIGEGLQLSPPASDSDSLASGVVEASTSTGGDGPSESCASDAEQMQWPECSRICHPPIATHGSPEHVWVPSGQASSQTLPQPHWMPSGQASIQRGPQPNWVGRPSGPAGIFHMFGGISEAERIHNRNLWS